MEEPAAGPPYRQTTHAGIGKGEVTSCKRGRGVCPPSLVPATAFTGHQVLEPAPYVSHFNVNLGATGDQDTHTVGSNTWVVVLQKCGRA